MSTLPFAARPLVLLLALLSLPACDTTSPGDDPGDDPDPISVIVRYRVSVSGAANAISVVYTDEGGNAVPLSVDFSRSTTFQQEITLAPGTEGTFSVAATGLVTGGNLTASTGSFRSDDESQIAFDTQTRTATGTEELSASAPVQVAVITAQPAL